MNDPAEIARAESFSARLALRAIAMDGTCTGEHGVGQKKIGYVEAEHSPETLDLMRRIKTAFDPTNLGALARDARPDAAHQGVVRSDEHVQSGEVFGSDGGQLEETRAPTASGPAPKTDDRIDAG